MAKSYDEWAAELQKAIEGAGDPATVVSVLTTSRDDYRDAMAEIEALTAERDKLNAERVRLENTNRELFLRIGQTLASTETGGQGQQEKTKAESITCEDLFKEE